MSCPNSQVTADDYSWIVRSQCNLEGKGLCQFDRTINQKVLRRCCCESRSRTSLSRVIDCSGGFSLSLRSYCSRQGTSVSPSVRSEATGSCRPMAEDVEFESMMLPSFAGKPWPKPPKTHCLLLNNLTLSLFERK